ncbi:MAG: VIT1/CCC1 transporter family protein [Pseudomonadota bacterium]|nr:VIT1/CCC1 transporter family protein [Pseudomonadota bacterium]
MPAHPDDSADSAKRLSPGRAPEATEADHRITGTGWLRAAVLGANDGIVSTGSLIIGVAAAHGSHTNILVAGAAGLVAGAMSMAAGEYVSVSSQSDAQKAALAQESSELVRNPESERSELAAIYVQRGLDAALAREVAVKLMEHDALGAHARDELGQSQATNARPLQAALASAGSFALGAALPMAMAALVSGSPLIVAVVLASLLALAALGALAAYAGGAPMLTGVARVTIWSALAMAATAGIGTLLGTAP